MLITERKLKNLIRKVIFEMEMSKMEKPGSGSITPRDRYDMTGRGMGYSIAQDLDKLVDAFLATGATLTAPQFAGYLVGAKSAGEIAKDVSDMYKKDKSKDKEIFKKNLKKYTLESGIDKAIGSVPAGKFLTKIPGYKALKGESKEVMDAIFGEIEGVVKTKASSAAKSKV